MKTKVAIYARCSTSEQFPENQVRVLRDLADKNDASVVAEFIDHGVSGVKSEREALSQMLAAARSKKFTVLYVLSIDRLSRSVKNLIETVETLNSLGVTIVFARESIDTTTAMGQFFLTVLGSLAQFEREIMRERINAGIARAKSEGKKFGRPSKLTHTVRSTITKLHQQGIGAREISKLCSLGVGTVYKVINELQQHDLATAA